MQANRSGTRNMAPRDTTDLRRRSGLRVFLRTLLGNLLLQLSFCQKLVETGALLIQLGRPYGLLSLHAALLQLAAVVGRLGVLSGGGDVSDGLALGDQVIGGLVLADDLVGCVAKAFHGGDPAQPAR